VRKGLALAGAGLLALALVLLLVAAQRGEVTLSLFVIVPVLTATGAAGVLGILLLIPALFLLFLSLLPAPSRAPQDVGGAAEGGGTEERSYGGVVLIGPVPILFGSAKGLRGTRTLGLLVAAATVLTVVMLLILLR
jgi:uncharacterized protein (TIGR00304 family)